MRSQVKKPDTLPMSIARIFELDVVFNRGKIIEVEGIRVKRSEFRDMLTEFRRPIFIESKELRKLPHGFVVDARKRYKKLRCTESQGAVNPPLHVKPKKAAEVLAEWGLE